MKAPVNRDDWDEEIRRLRATIEAQLRFSADKIVREEVEKILGRIKIITHQDLGRMEYDWFLERPLASHAKGEK